VKEKKKAKSAKVGAFPAVKSKDPGRWVLIPADDRNVIAGGGRRTVTTELMPVPGASGWVMRTIVATAEGNVSAALCFIPRK